MFLTAVGYTPPVFVTLSNTFSTFCSLSQIFAHFLSFCQTFSTFCTNSQIFSHFLWLSQLFAHFLMLSHYLPKILHIFSTFRHKNENINVDNTSNTIWLKNMSCQQKCSLCVSTLIPLLNLVKIYVHLFVDINIPPLKYVKKIATLNFSINFLTIISNKALNYNLFLLTS